MALCMPFCLHALTMANFYFYAFTFPLLCIYLHNCRTARLFFADAHHVLLVRTCRKLSMGSNSILGIADFFPSYLFERLVELKLE